MTYMNATSKWEEWYDDRNESRLTSLTFVNSNRLEDFRAAIHLSFRMPGVCAESVVGSVTLERTIPQNGVRLLGD